MYQSTQVPVWPADCLQNGPNLKFCLFFKQRPLALETVFGYIPDGKGFSMEANDEKSVFGVL